MSPIDESGSRRSRNDDCAFMVLTAYSHYNLRDLLIAAPSESIEYVGFPDDLYPVKIPKIELLVAVAPQDHACERHSRFEQECPICQDMMTCGKIVSQILPCGHLLCKDCEATLREQGAFRCPICRTGVMNVAPVKVMKE